MIDPQTPPARLPIPTGLLEGLNPEQRRAVETLDGAVLVVAGPGSGKTRVLTHRIAALVATKACRPWEILAVTFTNKAAGEMRERVAALVGEESAADMWVATFHSACARLLRYNYQAAGLPSGFTILDDSDTQRVLKAVLEGLGEGTEASDVKAAASDVSRAKNDGLSADEVAQRSPRLGRIFAGYQRRLNEMGSVDFDDLLLRALAMLQSNPEVAARYQNRFRYVLVDEFQDTNLVQYRLVRLLSALNGNICVVGDADQSIYSWRGSSPEVMDAFTRDHPGVEVVVLEENYRSTSAILEVCRAIISHNPAEHRPTLRTANPDGVPARLYLADDDRDEARFVIGDLAGRLNEHDSSAIIMRTNAQTRAFEDELARRGIPYQVLGALKFYDRAEVKDALAYLRAVANPFDAVSFARASGVPRRGLGETSLQAVIDLAQARFDGNLRSALESGLAESAFPTRARAGLERFAEALRAIEEASVAGPSAAVRAVLDCGLKQHHAADKLAGADRAANLEELLAGALNFEANPPRPLSEENDASVGDPATLVGFLENIALVSATDGDAGSQVSLMTAHASKGKEFDSVYVVGAEQGLFPLQRNSDDPELSAREERRLFFVACSRPRHRLTISGARSRFMHGRRVTNPPSEYLRDLPASVARVRASSSSSSSFSSPTVRPLSAPTGPRVAATALSEGARVRHRVFGIGVVEKVEGTVTDIRFDAGLKKLDLAFAPLELL